MVKNVYPCRQVEEGLARKYQFDDCGKLGRAASRWSDLRELPLPPKRIKGAALWGSRVRQVTS